ncbi:MAG: GNAT family N-acetyltransferase [bacterium]
MEKLDYKIRIAKSMKDELGILKVRDTTWAETYANPRLGITKLMIQNHLKRKFNEVYIQRYYETLKQKNIKNWIVQDSKKEIVGWLFCSKDTEIKGSIGMYLLPEFQSKGIGSKLIEREIKWLSKLKYIELEVVSYNEKAIKFYKKFGFKFTGNKSDFKIGDYTLKDARLEMRKTLRN